MYGLRQETRLAEADLQSLHVHKEDVILVCREHQYNVTDVMTVKIMVAAESGFPLYCGSEIRGLFKDFQGP